MRQKPQEKRHIYDIKIKFKSQYYIFKGFYDSGNTLTDPLTNMPVVILSKSVVDRLSENGVVTYDGYIEVETINGESTVPIIEIDEIHCGNAIYHGFGAIVERNMHDCDIILQNTLVYN
jgi:hypothetical protein